MCNSRTTSIPCPSGLIHFVILIIYILIETAKKKIERSEQIKDEFLTNAETKIEPLENEKTENLPEKVSKKSKKKSKKNKTEMPRDDILTEKALQRATEILEMLTD